MVVWKNRTTEIAQITKDMNKIKWFVIGFHLYVFPPDPKVGDIEALMKHLSFVGMLGFGLIGQYVWSLRAVCLA